MQHVPPGRVGQLRFGYVRSGSACFMTSVFQSIGRHISSCSCRLLVAVS